MNWITNYVRPRINSLFSRREVPENLWTKCPECGTMLFHRELSDNLNVCTNCDHHMAITPRDRLLAVSIILIWASNFIALRLGLDIMSPLALCTWRFLLSFFPACLLGPRPAARWRREGPAQGLSGSPDPPA